MVRHDTFDIKGTQGLEARVQTYIDSGSLFLKLYVEFSMPNEGIRSSIPLYIRKARTVKNVDSLTTLLESSHYDIPKSSIGRHSTISALDFHRGSDWQSTCDFGHFDTYTRRDDVLPTTSTGEGTSNMANVNGSKNEYGNGSDVDPVWEPSANGLEVALFFEPELVPIEPEDGEGEDGLEFVELPHNRLGHTSSSLDSSELKVGRELSMTDGFLAAIK
ncbi:hypothetical protein J1N35_037308 [Gossypium stocksii]|uniref:Uncharacterized protein n=1 Tax=Gossypium stocksii TaxID=47602 RepID=A0A9D3UKK3_9ROSI|nr:hypothetical protein J1N35_037308 [Gossypium stocksii]